MAQGDYFVQNQSFPSFRSDLNSTLEAINTSNSGTSRPTSAVAGTIWLDVTNATSPTLKLFDGTDDISLATFDYSANTVNWLDSTVSADLINDLSPQLGAMLDVNGNAIGNGTEELIKFSETASAVNELTVTNSATGNAPEISATGDDTNIDFKLTPKGTGKLILDGLNFPTSDGTADQVLTTDGAGNLSFADASGGGTQWQSSIVTGTTLSAVAGNGYWIDTTSNACTVTLPASASVGDTIEFVDYARTWETNSVTFNLNGLQYQGDNANNPVYNTNGQAVRIVYSGATQGWIPTSDDDVTFETQELSSYLVIAGGGGGGVGDGGGGGAGGYRNSFSSDPFSGRNSSIEDGIQLVPGTTYTISVGGGGSGASYPGKSPGSSGSDSSISAPGITTITSIGGGNGGSGDGGVAGDGGSGGGGGTSSGSGTAGQGFDGAPGGSRSGGGGAGQQGGTPGNADGGDGLSSSIDGSATFRAGGGGGSPSSTGGTGGGGAPVSPGTSSATAGATNTGSGGGGTDGGSSASGGSGVVFLRVATADYSGTTTGSPTVTTDGTFTVLKFTGSGSYTH